MDNKRKILDKSHPARQHVIDFTDLDSDPDQTPEVLVKSVLKKVSSGLSSTPASNVNHISRTPAKHLQILGRKLAKT